MTSASSQQKIVRMETQAMFPYLIEIVTPDDEIYRYANCDEDIIFEGKIFEAAYFKITPPEISENSIKDAKITISAIDEEWIERIRTYKQRSTIRFIAMIVYEINGSQSLEPLNDITMILTNATWNSSTIQWTMKFDDWMDINMPATKINEFTCPGLF